MGQRLGEPSGVREEIVIGGLSRRAAISASGRQARDELLVLGRLQALLQAC
ncbi:MAG TPA: hypothetical protein VGN42_06780 [Pirellulales bacterium]|jgi:hypothetical protein|nr:hypothetical protein [Pirellulales bacterium]